MTLAQLVVVPGILLGAFLAVILVIAGRVAGKKMTVLRARKKSYDTPPELLEKQAAVIADVIAGVYPFPSGDFRKDLYEQLIDAHGAYMDYKNKELS